MEYTSKYDVIWDAVMPYIIKTINAGVSSSIPLPIELFEAIGTRKDKFRVKIQYENGMKQMVTGSVVAESLNWKLYNNYVFSQFVKGRNVLITMEQSKFSIEIY